jgi:hypothetical protein
MDTVRAIEHVAILRADAVKMDAIVDNKEYSDQVRRTAQALCERCLLIASRIEDEFLRRGNR